MSNYTGYAPTTGRLAPPTRGRSAVAWGAVFSGALIGVAVMTLFTLLWYAIADGGSNVVSANLSWWLGGTAIVATFLAGLFAGWFDQGRSAGLGIVQGLTEWGLLAFAVVIVGPGLATIFRSLLAASPFTNTSTVLWTSFWSVLIGLGAALLGGIIGGALPAPAGGAGMVGETAAPAAGGMTTPVEGAATRRYAEGDVMGSGYTAPRPVAPEAGAAGGPTTPAGGEPVPAGTHAADRRSEHASRR